MKKYLFIVLVMLLVGLTSCSPAKEPPIQNSSEEAYQVAAPAGVKLLLDKGKKVILVDAGSAEEYKEKHIPGALLLTIDASADTQPKELPNLNDTIIVYSRSNDRSKEAVNKLLSLGYTDVRNLGNIADWKYATVTGTEPGVWRAPSEGSPSSDGILGDFYTPLLFGGMADESVLVSYRLTMVNVWATFCSPCIREMPELGELAAEYKEKGVQILGLAADVQKSDGTYDQAQLELAKSIVAQTNANYLHIIPSTDVYPVLNISEYVPATIFVDEYGNQIGEVYVGARSKEAWSTIIEQMLREVAK